MFTCELGRLCGGQINEHEGFEGSVHTFRRSAMVIDMQGLFHVPRNEQDVVKMQFYKICSA